MERRDFLKMVAGLMVLPPSADAADAILPPADPLFFGGQYEADQSHVVVCVGEQPPMHGAVEPIRLHYRQELKRLNPAMPTGSHRYKAGHFVGWLFLGKMVLDRSPLLEALASSEYMDMSFLTDGQHGIRCQSVVPRSIKRMTLTNDDKIVMEDSSWRFSDVMFLN